MSEYYYSLSNDEFYRIKLFNLLYRIVKDRNKEFTRKLKNSILLLKDLEYLIDDWVSFYNKLNENIKDLGNEINQDDEHISNFLNQLLLDELTKAVTSKSILNLILSAIEKYLDMDNYLEIFTEIEKKDDSKNIVFLSYAYVDKSYTIGLFYYFLTKGIYLYIDWMHNGKNLVGNILKNKLSTALKNANQFLFLDTANSQLAMPGNYTIRQWCAWEIGNYYEFNINNKLQRKFYLSIYYEKQLAKRQQKNLMLDDFKPVTKIINGLIY